MLARSRAVNSCTAAMAVCRLTGCNSVFMPPSMMRIAPEVRRSMRAYPFRPRSQVVPQLM